MSDGILSQEEIDALLKGDDDVNLEIPEIQEETHASEFLTEIEKDAIGELANITMGTASTTLSTLLGKKVIITTPHVDITTKEQFEKEYPTPHTLVDVKYTEGLVGSNILILKNCDTAIIADLMMGGDGSADFGEISEIHISAISEAMNQMMGSASTSLSSLINRTINIAPPDVELVDIETEGLRIDTDIDFSNLVMVAFNMQIEDLIDSKLMQLIPIEFAKEMANSLINNIGSSTPESVPEPTPSANAPEPSVAMDNNTAASQGNSGMSSINIPPREAERTPNVDVSPLEFQQLEVSNTSTGNQNLDLIMDVALKVSVELGRTTKSVREILDFSTGSIIELNKLAGEAVDLLINGKLFAKGEVVVIDENFGVRIVDIVSPMERVKNLQ